MVFVKIYNTGIHLLMAFIVEMKALRTSNVEIAGFVKMSGYDGPKTTQCKRIIKSRCTT